MIDAQPPRPEDFARRIAAGRDMARDPAGAIPSCGDFDLRIARDGRWYYRGTPILRPALCKLFATVLRREADGSYWLVTPVERGRIAVEDAPFLAVEMAEKMGPDGAELHFRTNLDEWVRADQDHPIRVDTDEETGEPGPYVMVRGGLEAKLARPVFYELVERAEEQDGRLIVASAGAAFELGEVA